jgi:catechol 2,3-dioxygenase-like lactoylglutathione lyase family enzyme
MPHPQVDVRFDHTIIAARDKHESARFFTGIFGLPEPQEAGFFVAVHLTDGRVLDFAEPPVDFPGQHYAFLVSDDTFDAIMERIRARSVPYWADPQMRRPGEISTSHGGGVCTSTTRPATTWKRSPPATTVTPA